MGLDVYAHKVKNLESYNKYLVACYNYNNYNNFLWQKYDKEVSEAYNKYCEWENMHQMDKNYADEDNPYSYNINTFITEEETNNDKELAQCKERAMKDCQYCEIESLYMRKHYWFIQYLYHKYDDKMVIQDGETVKTFTGDQFILTKTDLKDIIDRLQRVINESPKRLVSCYGDPVGDDTQVIKEVMDREFPIYINYHFSARMDWNYNYHTLNSYLNDFKKVYSEMNDEELLIYIESW